MQRDGLPRLHLTLTDRGESFGFAAVSSWEWIKSGWWYLNNIEIDEDWRGFGFGGLLLIKMFEELRKRDAIGISVAPAGDLEKLERFYRRHGFAPEPGGGLHMWKKWLNKTSPEEGIRK